MKGLILYFLIDKLFSLVGMAWILMICISHNSPKHNNYLTDQNGPKTYLIIHILNNKNKNYNFFLFTKNYLWHIEFWQKKQTKMKKIF